MHAMACWRLGSYAPAWWVIQYLCSQCPLISFDAVFYLIINHIYVNIHVYSRIACIWNDSWRITCIGLSSSVCLKHFCFDNIDEMLKFPLSYLKKTVWPWALTSMSFWLSMSSFQFEVARWFCDVSFKICTMGKKFGHSIYKIEQNQKRLWHTYAPFLWTPRRRK